MCRETRRETGQPSGGEPVARAEGPGRPVPGKRVTGARAVLPGTGDPAAGQPRRGVRGAGVGRSSVSRFHIHFGSREHSNKINSK